MVATFLFHAYLTIKRRAIMSWRKKSEFVEIIIPCVITVAMAILFDHMLDIIGTRDLDPKPYSFNDCRLVNPQYAVVIPNSLLSNQEVIDYNKSIYETIKNETDIAPQCLQYESREAMNAEIYGTMKNGTSPYNVLFGIEFGKDFSSSNYQINLIYNETSFPGNYDIGTLVNHFFRILAHSKGLGKLQVRTVGILGSMARKLVGQYSALFFLIGFFSLCNTYARKVIEDLRKKKRDYLESCNLSLVGYWLGTFACDFIIYSILAIISWLAMLISQSPTFKDHSGATLFCIEVMGISMILVTYCFSFIFDDPQTGSTTIMILQVAPTILIMFIDIIRGTKGDKWVPWIYALYPSSGGQQFISSIGFFKHGFDKMWSDSTIKKPLIGMLINIPLYSLILAIIEFLRKKIDSQTTKAQYKNHITFFEQKKGLCKITKEATDMEKSIDMSNINDYAVRISHVSRLFFNNNGQPLAAVNDVSLGVKRGELFGFLGANGAGKTTLMNMIMGNIPLSNGTIYVNGKEHTTKEGAISICPQFNDHLTDEMTPVEILRMFGELFGRSEDVIEHFINDLIPLVELSEHKDKQVSELSGGNARKLCILVSFLAPSSIVLLDEPTSSLDPVARHKIHELIGQFKEEKTFMLCTHLLDEAESLCTNISMMISGCIYTVGTPQYLSSRFGTEWKVDLLLQDPSFKPGIMSLFEKSLPGSHITIDRPTNLIYSVPSTVITLTDLFKLMKAQMTPDKGVKYFTCSCSTLETVFLELVKLSEESN